VTGLAAAAVASGMTGVVVEVAGWGVGRGREVRVGRGLVVLGQVGRVGRGILTIAGRGRAGLVVRDRMGRDRMDRHGVIARRGKDGNFVGGRGRRIRVRTGVGRVRRIVVMAGKGLRRCAGGSRD
jgi:hypothetical protein